MTRNEQIIALKKTTDLSMSQIARQLGVSKNVVQGVITREGSTVTPQGGEPRTLYQRCDALHAQMDAVLSATKDVPGLRIKGTGYQVPTVTWAFPRSLTRGMTHGN